MLALAQELELSGIIMMGKPGYIFAEGERSAVEEAVKRVKSWHWREVRLNFEETVAVVVNGDGATPWEVGNPEGGDGGAVLRLRLMQRDGMAIVPEAEFMSAFRAAGRLDILEAGTGCPQSSG